MNQQQETVSVRCLLLCRWIRFLKIRQYVHLHFGSVMVLLYVTNYLHCWTLVVPTADQAGRISMRQPATPASNTASSLHQSNKYKQEKSLLLWHFPGTSISWHERSVSGLWMAKTGGLDYNCVIGFTSEIPSKKFCINHPPTMKKCSLNHYECFCMASQIVCCATFPLLNLL